MTPRSLVLHCSNLYSGLWASWLEGFVSEAATKLFGLADIQLQLLGGSEEGHMRHRTWRVCYPELPIPPGSWGRKLAMHHLRRGLLA